MVKDGIFLGESRSTFASLLSEMNLFEKSEAVKEVFRQLESESRQFQTDGGLACVSGCGFCCANPKIPASPLEFLPLAFDLYEKGVAEDVANRLALQDELEICVLYRSQSEDQTKGFCGNYGGRGLICRLFGASARKNKYGQKELITCKVLKTNKPQDYADATSRINSGLDIPMAMAFYTRLYDVDESLTTQYPINQAILVALELVLRFKFYEEAG
ncbi:YkgJ family cysteine cluster protein [Algoriphagus aestuariicola]|jgi:hypothetical protein